jgi:hypothetical protein
MLELLAGNAVELVSKVEKDGSTGGNGLGTLR